MRGIVVAGLIAAVMAALSAQVNSASTLFSTDIYKKLIHKEAATAKWCASGRIASFVVLLLAAVLSPVVGLFGIFKFFQFTLTAIAIPFMATVLMGILWKRVNYAAGLFGLLGGVLITASLLAIFSGRWAAIPQLHFFYIGGIAEVVIMIGIAAGDPADRSARLRQDRSLRMACRTAADLRRRGAPSLVSATEAVVRHRDRDLALSLLAILVGRCERRS